MELSLHVLVTFVSIIILFGSIIIHEVSHGFAAYLLGDDTAKRRGRLKLNPLVHIDLFGTIILPIALFFLFKFPFGWAKPVPINPYNFKNMKRDMGITALAGPLSNFTIALVLSIVIRILIGSLHLGEGGGIAIGLQYLMAILTQLVIINLFLCFFNLIPFPPLDGSKVLGAFLPDSIYYKYVTQERIGMVIFVGLILFSTVLHLDIFGGILSPIVMHIFQVMTGLH
jgi:Zn-dependent protease